MRGIMHIIGNGHAIILLSILFVWATAIAAGAIEPPPDVGSAMIQN